MIGPMPAREVWILQYGGDGTDAVMLSAETAAGSILNVKCKLAWLKVPSALCHNAEKINHRLIFTNGWIALATATTAFHDDSI